MLTPADIRNPKRKSGYNYVTFNPGSSRKGPYYAKHNTGGTSDPTRPSWHGPRRASALEAAQDYCDYVNGLGVPTPTANKSAGHKRPKGPKRRVPSDIQAAKGMVRDWEAQQRRNVQGYVYCITDGTAVKIGYSVAPEKRVPELQTGNPRVLTLLGFLKGTEADERRLHRKHRAENILQEWFRPTPAVLSEFNITPAAMRRALQKGVSDHY